MLQSRGKAVVSQSTSDDDGRAEGGIELEERYRERLREMADAGFGDMARHVYARSTRAVDASVLTDSFLRRHSYLRISLTERCNLRCLYCMPEEGVDLTPKAHLMTTEEIGRMAELFVKCGIRKIRLTGGEPTLRGDLVDVVKTLGELPGLDQIGMTSNGIVLSRHLPQLREAGLTHLNVSLDTLRPERFEAMTRRSGRGLSKVLGAVDAALGLGFDKVKLNVVVMKGENEDEVLNFVRMTRDKALNVRFIEWMPFDGNVWSHHKMEPYRTTRARIESCFGPLERTNASEESAVAKDFRVPGHAGEVSFVTSMTEHFCDSCNRLRLMADGNFKVCLFGAEETNLLGPLREGRTDEEMAAVIHAAVQRKKAKHAGMFELSRLPNRAMVRIGG